MIIIEINGKKLEVAAGSMIIEAADAAGINIPRFCYHKKLSIAANCRMCLVDVDKAPKPLPACATPVNAGMKIFTHTARALEAQRNVMEFLLINHPLDCPICDQAGECELQDLAMGYGPDLSLYGEAKRVVQDKDLGPLIATDMTRCIHCTRCVRFGDEVAGLREMGAVGRGENVEIGTFVEQALTSEVSGNIIDLCPVGALTSKPFRFQARSWEMISRPSIAPHDCLGSNIYLHTRAQEVMRTVPRENEAINEVWLSDRDRFSYQALHHERLEQPMIKRDNHWQIVSWSAALAEVKLRLETIKPVAAGQLAAVLSPNSTLEEGYLLQKLLRALGCHNVDHRLRMQDFSQDDAWPLYPSLGSSIQSLEQMQMLLLVGSLIHKEQPLLSIRLNKMSNMGGKIAVINSVAAKFNFKVMAEDIVTAGDLLSGLAKVLKAVLRLKPKDLAEPMNELLKAYIPEVSHTLMAESLLKAQTKGQIILGALALNHPQCNEILAVARELAESTAASFGVLTEGANSAGLWWLGAIPHRTAAGLKTVSLGLNSKQIWQHHLKSYLLFGVEPDLDTADGTEAMRALENAESVVAFSAYDSPSLRKVADVLLPITPFSEQAGTWINIEGLWQEFTAALKPHAESRPAWKVLRVLANLLNLPHFDYPDLSVLQAELHTFKTAALASWSQVIPAQRAADIPLSHALVRIAPVPMYAVDAIVRRAEALQQCVDAGGSSVRINAQAALQRGLSHGTLVRLRSPDATLELPLVIDDLVPNGSLVLAGALKETQGLGAAYAHLEIERSTSHP